jgi:hypothetical protein
VYEREGKLFYPGSEPNIIEKVDWVPRA